MEDDFEATYERFENMSIGSRFRIDTYQPLVDIYSLSPEEREREFARILAWKKNNFDKIILSLTEDIISKVLGQVSTFKDTDYASLETHAQRTETLNLQLLKEKILDHKRAIEQIDECIIVLANLKKEVEEQAKEYKYSQKIFHIKRANRVEGFTISDYDGWLTEKTEWLAVLKEAKKWHLQVIEAFQKVISERQNRKGEILKRIKEAEKLCHEAEKMEEKIIKAGQKCKESLYTDFSSAAEYVNGRKRLAELRSKFFTLRGDGVEFSDYASPEPVFPDLPVNAETLQAQNRIESFYNREVSKHRKGD